MPNPMSIDERARDLHYMLIEEGVIVDESPRDNHGTREALIAAIRAAVEQEREACAGVAETTLNYKDKPVANALLIAKKIRSRTTPTAGEEKGDE